MNLVPANALQKLMAGDLATLAGSSNWSSIQLGHGEVFALMIRRGLFMLGGSQKLGKKSWLSRCQWQGTWSDGLR